MLWLLGVQMAYVFGIITFVLNFIPNLGPLIATFLPMPLVIFDPGEKPQNKGVETPLLQTLPGFSFDVRIEKVTKG